MKRNLFKPATLIFIFLFTVLSCLHPLYPREMLLQHSATVIVMIFLFWVYRKKELSNPAFSLIALMLVLHIIGARWIYSYVPYEKWFESLFGFSVNGLFHMKRNGYDRFVHFMFGFLVLYPAKEIFNNWLHVPPKYCGLFALMFIMAASMLYEVFEWSLAVMLSPEDAEAYNGQQGDAWDAQKDMALAAVGALLILIGFKVRKVMLGGRESKLAF